MSMIFEFSVKKKYLKISSYIFNLKNFAGQWDPNRYYLGQAEPGSNGIKRIDTPLSSKTVASSLDAV